MGFLSDIAAADAAFLLQDGGDAVTLWPQGESANAVQILGAFDIGDRPAQFGAHVGAKVKFDRGKTIETRAVMYVAASPKSVADGSDVTLSEDDKKRDQWLIGEDVYSTAAMDPAQGGMRKCHLVFVDNVRTMSNLVTHSGR